MLVSRSLIWFSASHILRHPVCEPTAHPLNLALACLDGDGLRKQQELKKSHGFYRMLRNIGSNATMQCKATSNWTPRCVLPQKTPKVVVVGPKNPNALSVKCCWWMNSRWSEGDFTGPDISPLFLSRYWYGNCDFFKVPQFRSWSSSSRFHNLRNMLKLRNAFWINAMFWNVALLEWSQFWINCLCNRLAVRRRVPS